jgi:hypothetical protein
MPGTRIDLTVDLDSRTQVPCDYSKPLMAAVTQTELSSSKKPCEGTRFGLATEPWQLPSA